MRLKSSLVYKFSCAQCASEYVGMTARTLSTRVDEHVGVGWGGMHKSSCGRLSKRRSNSQRVLGLAVSVLI